MNIQFSSGTQCWRLLTALLAASLCLSSCGLFRGGRGKGKQKHEQAQSLGDVRLAPRTVVFIEVFEGGESTMSVDLTVDAGGNLLVPIVGEVSVDGMTPLDAAKKIEFLARRRRGQNHLSGPRVHVKAIDRRAVVLVSGHVNRSGPVTFHSGLTVAEAIEAAGGATADANAGSVGLTTGGRTKIVTTPETRELVEGDVVNVPRRL